VRLTGPMLTGLWPPFSRQLPAGLWVSLITGIKQSVFIVLAQHNLAQKWRPGHTTPLTIARPSLFTVLASVHMYAPVADVLLQCQAGTADMKRSGTLTLSEFRTMG
jgi:hypothetical protein